MNWVPIEERLPEHMQKVVCFLPDNFQFVGKSEETRHEPIVILRFMQDFFESDSDKWVKFGPHFWAGEGLSNHYMPDVTHWMPLPEAP